KRILDREHDKREQLEREELGVEARTVERYRFDHDGADIEEDERDDRLAGDPREPVADQAVLEDAIEAVAQLGDGAGALRIHWRRVSPRAARRRPRNWARSRSDGPRPW